MFYGYDHSEATCLTVLKPDWTFSRKAGPFYTKDKCLMTNFMS
jgi:hypothetical protein